MSRGYRNVLTAMFILMTFVSWAAPIAGPAAQAESTDQPARASACAASAYHVTPGENATMTIKNDGGWCWADTYERSYWRILSAYDVTVIKPPKNGLVRMRDIGNQEVRVAYRPDTGFAGTDSFVVHYQVNAYDLTYSVTVSK